MEPSVAQGVDVSHYEGIVEWAEVLGAGYSFAFTKATQGLSEVDPMFATNWAAMAACGITRGAYHYFMPGDDGMAQADHFLSVVDQRLITDMPPALDIEQPLNGVDASTAIANIQAFCDRIQAVTGHTCILYFDIPYWTDTLGDPQQFSAAKHPCWIARYTDACGPGTLPGGWTDWTFWQYAAPDPGAPQVNVPGIGITDVDRFNGSHNGLLQRFGI